MVDTLGLHSKPAICNNLGPKLKEHFLVQVSVTRAQSCSLNEVKDEGLNQIHNLDFLLFIHRFDCMLDAAVFVLPNCSEKIPFSQNRLAVMKA